MNVVYKPPAQEPIPAVVCIGVFDGVHLGHKAVVGRCIDAARERNVASAVVTFDRDPERVLLPETDVPQVCTLDQKISFISDLHPDYLLVLPFDRSMAALGPEEFLDSHLLPAFAPAAVVVGVNFRFGARGSGDVELLEEYGRDHRFDVEALPLLSAGGEPISSTRIRALLQAGEVDEAARLLGRPFAVEGTVVAGAGRGATVGFHTANVQLPAELAIPARGVYAGAVTLEEEYHPCAINVGTRPTFETSGKVWVEVHVIGLEADLYGRHLDVLFLARLRMEKRFEGAHELRRQAAADIAHARSVFERSDLGVPHE